LRNPAAVLILYLTWCGTSAHAGELAVSAVAPNVTVETRAAGRHFIRLPALEYAFVIDARCRTDLLPTSLSLSIADTRVAIPADDISVDAPVELTVRIPAGQIGPVAVEGFCIRNDAGVQSSEAFRETVSIPSVLSVQASLLCSSETDSEMTYASQTLDVTLTCEHAGEEDRTTTP
jgi:hypothetical protein